MTTEIVTDASRLREIVDEFMDAPRYALDMESDGYYRYHDRVCIITLSHEGRDYVLDTLALGDATQELQRLLHRDDAPCMMHSGLNDVLAVKRDWPIEFTSVQDTSVAAILLGLEKTGLANLVGDHLNIELEKEFQRHDWAARPIRSEHVGYLINDTCHLFALHDRMETLLRDNDLMNEYEIECEFVARAEPRQTEFDPERFRRIKGHGELSDAKRGALRELYAWRDLVARERDIAAFRIVRDRVLLQLAIHTPTDVDGLARARGLDRELIDNCAPEILERIQTGLANPVPARPTRKPKTDTPRRLKAEERDALGRLKKWREEETKRRGVGLQAVLPTPTLLPLVLEAPQDTSEIAQIERIGPARAERYADEILQILHTS